MPRSEHSDCAQENVFLRDFLQELGTIMLPTVVYSDNAAALSLCVPKARVHRRSKHFSIDFEYFKQAVQIGEINAKFVQGVSNWADYFTKHIAGPRFTVLREESLGQQEVFREMECNPFPTPRSIPRAMTAFRRNPPSDADLARERVFQSSFEGFMLRQQQRTQCCSQEDIETTGG